MEDLDKKVMEAVNYINTRISVNPDIAIVLGSGLGNLAYEIQDSIEIRFDEIPHFKTPTSEGHEGKLIFGKLYDKNVVAMQGRLHVYEGYSMSEIAFPIRVFAILGVAVLFVTNSAGSVSANLKPGDLMLISDHINFSGYSPLTGPNYELFGTRFPSMKEVYNHKLIDIAKQVAKDLNIGIKEGIYYYMTGPQYGTEAEIKAIASTGASVVGMSTVPEVIAAAHSNIAVIGISCVTNMADSLIDTPSHVEVLEVYNKAEKDFSALVLDTIKRIEFD